uniref:Uncharacterized protein n=1 Tax=Steinernema glaseri TaxID=37863 RepID=A0A1I7YW00_9BILA
MFCAAARLNYSTLTISRHRSSCKGQPPTPQRLSLARSLSAGAALAASESVAAVPPSIHAVAARGGLTYKYRAPPFEEEERNGKRFRDDSRRTATTYVFVIVRRSQYVRK